MLLNLPYKFNYDGEKRVVVPTSKKDSWTGDSAYTCYDFTVGAFRTFKKSKMSDLESIVENFRIMEYDERDERKFQENGGSTFKLDDVLFVCNLGG